MTLTYIIYGDFMALALCSGVNFDPEHVDGGGGQEGQGDGHLLPLVGQRGIREELSRGGGISGWTHTRQARLVADSGAHGRPDGGGRRRGYAARGRQRKRGGRKTLKTMKKSSFILRILFFFRYLRRRTGRRLFALRSCSLFRA